MLVGLLLSSSPPVHLRRIHLGNDCGLHSPCFTLHLGALHASYVSVSQVLNVHDTSCRSRLSTECYYALWRCLLETKLLCKYIIRIASKCTFFFVLRYKIMNVDKIVCLSYRVCDL